MNKHQRNKNRNTSSMLKRAVRRKILKNHICENCGEKGGHWVSTRPTTLAGIMDGIDDQEGFWTCGWVWLKPEPWLWP